MFRRTPSALHLPWTVLTLLVLGLGSLSTPRLTAGATYHVTTGGGGSTCSSGSPCGSLNTGVSKLTQPGDVLYIHGGTYEQSIEGNNFIGQLAGTESNPITIASFPGETATIHGYLNIGDGSHQYLIFDGLHVDGTGLLTAPISFGTGSDGGAHHLTFQNGEVRNSQLGLNPPESQIVPNVFFYGHHNTFRNSSSHHSWQSYGFYFSASHHNTLDNVDIYNNCGYGFQIYTGGGYDPNNGYHVISNSKIYNNGARCNYAAFNVRACEGVLIYNNVIYNNDQGVDIGDDSRGTQLYNNSIYGSTFGAGIFIGGGINVVIQNNIVYGNNVSGIEDNTGGNANISNNTTTNPSFVDAGGGDFRLNPDSNSLSNGLNLSNIFTVDKDGNDRPASGNWSRGAYQFGGGTPPGLPAPTNLRLISQTP